MSPSSRTLAELKKQGYIAQSVERYNSFSKTRTDYLGVIDIIAFKPGILGVLGVQATTESHAIARVGKALKEPRLSSWLKCNNLFEVWAWAKQGPRNKAKHWRLKRRRVVERSNILGWYELEEVEESCPPKPNLTFDFRN